jgi:hypothetical protein
MAHYALPICKMFWLSAVAPLLSTRNSTISLQLSGFVPVNLPHRTADVAAVCSVLNSAAQFIWETCFGWWDFCCLCFVANNSNSHHPADCSSWLLSTASCSAWPNFLQCFLIVEFKSSLASYTPAWYGNRSPFQKNFLSSWWLARCRTDDRSLHTAFYFHFPLLLKWCKSSAPPGETKVHLPGRSTHVWICFQLEIGRSAFVTVAYYHCGREDLLDGANESVNLSTSF